MPYLDDAADGLYRYLQEHMINWRGVFNQNLRYTGKFDCMKIGYPVAKQCKANEGKGRQNGADSEGGEHGAVSDEES